MPYTLLGKPLIGFAEDFGQYATPWDERRILDVVKDPLGFRWVRFDSQKGFFLSGQRVQIRGTN